MTIVPNDNSMEPFQVLDPYNLTYTLKPNPVIKGIEPRYSFLRYVSLCIGCTTLVMIVYS